MKKSSLSLVTNLLYCFAPAGLVIGEFIFGIRSGRKDEYGRCAKMLAKKGIDISKDVGISSWKEL